MGNHQAGDVVFLHDVLRQLQHLFRRSGIQRRRMLIQQQHLRHVIGGHQQRQRLALSAGQQSHRLAHPVLQSHAQQTEPIPECLFICVGNPGEPAAVSGCQRQVFLNAHVRRAAPHRVLEQPADLPCPLVFRHHGHVLSAQVDGSGIQHKASADRVEQGGFSRSVRADNAHKVPVLNLQGNINQCLLLVRRTGMEGFAYILQFQHQALLPSREAFHRRMISGSCCRR